MFKNIDVYAKELIGSIHGWDRIRFLGTIRWLASVRGLGTYLNSMGVLLKDFGKFAEGLTSKVRDGCERQAKELGVPFIYLRSGGVRKDELARDIAKQRGIETGDICFFSVVEPCLAPTVMGNRESERLEVVMRLRKCLWFYHYWNDPKIGFGHTRLQSWIPFTTTICINGRHWLERQLIEHQINYIKDNNCFPWIEQVERAQQLSYEQLNTNWEELLGGLQLRACPELPAIFGGQLMRYYWSAQETEWASDLMFRDAAQLDAIYPGLLRYCMLSARSSEVMRFLGRNNRVGKMPNEVVSDLTSRYEGVRIKHRSNCNSVKMYNKAGSVLRVETTINNPREFKVFRHANDDQKSAPSWQKMRKGVSDMHRRAKVSHGCNSRYAEHVESSQYTGPLGAQVTPLCQRTIHKNRRYRALNLWNREDHKVIEFIARGEHLINGFRNKDLRNCLYLPTPANDKSQQRKNSAKISRRLALLRAHGLIRKVTKSHRYILTKKGRKIANAFLSASNADYQKLTELAA